MCYKVITGSVPSYLFNYCTFKVLSVLSALIRNTNAQTPTLQLQNPWLSHFHILQLQHLEQFSSRHQALCYSLFLQKPTEDIYLLRIFQLSNIVFYPYQSVQCVCVCVCLGCSCSLKFLLDFPAWFSFKAHTLLVFASHMILSCCCHSV